MPWERLTKNALFAFYQRLTSLNKHLPALRYGHLHICGCEDGVLVYRLEQELGDVLCVLNLSDVIKVFSDDYVTNKGFHLEREYMSGIDWANEWTLRPCEGAVFLSAKRSAKAKQLKAKDFRQLGS